MPWKCRLVKPVGERYEVVYMSEQDDNRRPCIIHSRRYDISEEDWKDKNKFDHYSTNDLMPCDRCGEFFTTNSTSFASQTVWNTEDGHLHIGDMYYGLMTEEEHPGYHKYFMSNEYNRDHAGKRSPIYVATPGGMWCIDGKASNAQDGSGWVVTGEAPNITARPSISMHRYHGWLTNGELSDDLEGRTYSDSIIKY